MLFVLQSSAERRNYTMRVADIHAHIFPAKIAEKASSAIGTFYNKPSMLLGTFEHLAEQEREAGIEYFIASSSATVAAQVSHINDFVAACGHAADNVIVFGSLFPTMENWEPELERMLELGIRGVKVHPDFQKINIDDPAAVPMYRAIAKVGLPVLFHVGDNRYNYSSPERLLNLIRQVPDLIAIAAHFGGWQSWDKTCKCIMPENVFYDTSSSLMYIDQNYALELLEKLGAHRFLFGTDFPMWTPKTELARFLDLGLDETTRDRILFGNFETLFLK